MNERKRIRGGLQAGVAGTLAWLSLSVVAQTVEWNTVDNGAARLSASPFTLAATIGQADAAAPRSAGEMTLSSGYWPVATLADLEVSATAQSVPVIAGSLATYSVEVLNRGAATTTATLTVSLPTELNSATTSGCAEDPAGVPICTLPTVTPGDSIHVFVQAQAAGILPPTLASNFSVDGTAFESDATDNTATLDSPTSAETALTLSNAVSSEPVVAGETVTYTLTVANDGPSDDPASKLAAQFDAALGCGWTSLASGGAGGNTDAGAPSELNETLVLPADGFVTYTIECAIDPAHRNTLVNRFKANSAIDPRDETEIETLTSVAARADLVLSPMASEPALEPGASVDYALTVINQGVSSALAVELATTLGKGLAFETADEGCIFDGIQTVICDLGDLAPGSQVMRMITAINEPSRGLRQVTATVTSATPDPDTSNNSASSTGFSAFPIPIDSQQGRLLLMLGLLAIGMLTLRRNTA